MHDRRRAVSAVSWGRGGGWGAGPLLEVHLCLGPREEGQAKPLFCTGSGWSRKGQLYDPRTSHAYSLRPQEYGGRRALYCLSGLGQGSHHSHSLPETDTWGADLCNPSSKGQCEQQGNLIPTSFKPQTGSSSGIPSAEIISFQL